MPEEIEYTNESGHMKTVKLYLKKDKESSIMKGHPWVYVQAFKEVPAQLETGDLVEVISHKNKCCGFGYADISSQILVRMLPVYGLADFPAELSRLVLSACMLRKDFFYDSACTNAFRVINGEGDGIPGLIVDMYDSAMVIQIYSLGLQNHIKTITAALLKSFPKTKWIWRRDQIKLAKTGQAKLIHGENLPEKVQFVENHLKYQTDLIKGQKTGFFLDQRENRKLIQSISQGRYMLNICGYTGAFSVAAAAGGARRTLTVDIAQPALDEAMENLALNGFSSSQHTAVAADMYDFLSSKKAAGFNLLVVDPPSMANNKRDLPKAQNAYRRLNNLAIKAVKPGGYLFTASCTSQLSREGFIELVRKAAQGTNRQIRIVSETFHAPDHPISLPHPEGRYLKGLLIRVN